MNRTLTVVFDEMPPWENAHGTFYPVGALFDDGSLLQANKKERHHAQELRGILIELINIECDYYCDDKGLSKNGNQKWGLKAILDLEGGAIYGKVPNVGGGGQQPTERPFQKRSAGGPVEPPRPPTTSDKDAEIRAAVALKAAVELSPTNAAPEYVLTNADIFNEWLESKSSGPVQSSSPGLTPSAPPTPGTPAGPGNPSAGSPTSVGEVDGPADTTSGGSGVEEGPAPTGTSYEERWKGMGITE